MYAEPAGTRAPRLRFQRAALAFMRWMAERGVLNPLDGARPVSSWWRAMNERLLRDSCEALAGAAGHGGPPSAETVGLWRAFIDRPTAQTWYRAHNASVVASSAGGRLWPSRLRASRLPSEWGIDAGHIRSHPANVALRQARWTGPAPSSAREEEEGVTEIGVPDPVEPEIEVIPAVEPVPGPIEVPAPLPTPGREPERVPA